MDVDEDTGCWPGDDTTPGYCGCPMTHPFAVFLLHLTGVWFFMSGQSKVGFTGEPCWADDPAAWLDDDWEYDDEWT